jgi:hypothetical protein
MEFASVRVDVVLIDLVGEDEELVLVSELDDVLDILPEKITLNFTSSG